MQVYLVGGAVRDELLGYPVKEFDYVVVGATLAQMEAEGFKPVGKDFPVFIHPQSGDEYALARTERKTGGGYQGFACDSNPSVTLEEDLLRRDLTINAIAKSTNGQIVDPYDGRRDIANKLLRHVSDAFREDPVRILRVARFAARYQHLGFKVAATTMALMREMVASGEADFLVAERIWKEFSRALSERHPEAFVTILENCGALQKIMPEIHALLHLQSPEPDNPEPDNCDALLALRRACVISPSPSIRFATLMHDFPDGNKALDEFFDRLKVPNEFRELSRLVVDFHSAYQAAPQLGAAQLLRLLVQADALRRPQRFANSLLCCRAHAERRWPTDGYPPQRFLLSALQAVNAVDPQALIAQGFAGAALGKALAQARVQGLAAFKKGRRY